MKGYLKMWKSLQILCEDCRHCTKPREDQQILDFNDNLITENRKKDFLIDNTKKEIIEIIDLN